MQRDNTADYTYVTYVVSMMVWTMAAYVTLKLIEFVHGYVDVKLIILYLMGMCTLQCILYAGEIGPENFLDKNLIEKWYGGSHGGFHKMYVVEIENVWMR